MSNQPTGFIWAIGPVDNGGQRLIGAENGPFTFVHESCCQI